MCYIVALVCYYTASSSSAAAERSLKCINYDHSNVKYCPANSHLISLDGVVAQSIHTYEDSIFLEAENNKI